jgi:hypothetical protein
VRFGGTLAQVLTAGVQLGSKFIEVYQSDVDPPANQQVLATEGAALKRNLFPLRLRRDADHYDIIAKIGTAAGARTGSVRPTRAGTSGRRSRSCREIDDRQN